MAHIPRLLASLVIAAGAVTVVGLAPNVSAIPNVDGESATAVIKQLQEQGYTVDVNGSPAGDTSLLSTCTVTSIRKPGDPTSDPTTSATVYVDVACPLTHG